MGAIGTNQGVLKVSFVAFGSQRGIWKFESVAYKDNDLVCSAEILCADRSLDE